MDVAVFTQAKDARRPEDNEDRVVIVKGRAYGVIDGVTDKTGKRFDGLTGGQIAARLIESTLQRAVRDCPVESLDGQTLIGRINEDFQAAFRRMGVGVSSDAPAVVPLAAQLVLALILPSRVRFLLVGDAGLRINGSEVVRQSFPLDRIGAAVRTLVWHHMMDVSSDREAADRVARSYTVSGLKAVLPDSIRWIDAETLAAIRRRALEIAQEVLPEVPPAMIETAVNSGMREQYRYANRLHPLGFATLNGFPVPQQMIVEFERDISEMQSIELFSDGYFGCPDGTGLDDWEDWFARVEEEDPAKVGRHESTKGSIAGRYADDRTVVVLANSVPIEARRGSRDENVIEHLGRGGR